MFINYPGDLRGLDVLLLKFFEHWLAHSKRPSSVTYLLLKICLTKTFPP